MVIVFEINIEMPKRTHVEISEIAKSFMSSITSYDLTISCKNSFFFFFLIVNITNIPQHTSLVQRVEYFGKHE